jgi:RNA ligase (TIGR02306 family)
MSNLIIEVCEVSNVRAHPGADKLDIGVIKGWQVVVPKGTFKTGDRIVYFPPDTLLSKEWTEKFGVTKYCSEKPEGMRIHQVKLRGEPSFGLAVMCPDPAWEVGKDVADFYGAKKYFPPVLFRCEDAETPHPAFVQYTEIQNMRHFPSVFQIGEPVVLTEKIHGGNSRVGIVDGVRMAGSHEHRRKEPPLREYYATSLYWFPWTIVNIQNMIDELAKDHKAVILFGEIFGKVQSLRYNKDKTLDYRVFDIILDGKYMDWEPYRLLCEKFGVQRCPTIGEIPYSLEAVAKLSGGKTLVNNAGHIREGVVVRPLIERRDPKIGRVILKYVSDEYLTSKHQQQDTTDV